MAAEHSGGCQVSYASHFPAVACNKITGQLLPVFMVKNLLTADNRKDALYSVMRHMVSPIAECVNVHETEMSNMEAGIVDVLALL